MNNNFKTYDKYTYVMSIVFTSVIIICSQIYMYHYVRIVMPINYTVKTRY